jgi:hypothetical protein
MRLVSLLAAVSAALAADGGVQKSLTYAKTEVSTKEIPQELRNLEIPPMLLPGCHKVSELWSNAACGFIVAKSLASPPLAFSSAVPFKAAIHAPTHSTDPLSPKVSIAWYSHAEWPKPCLLALHSALHTSP